MKQKKDEEKIYSYLKSGMVLVACGGITNDIINPHNGKAGCPEILTDCIWMWPGDLAYYVKTYHLRLNHEFLKTMSENNWSVIDS